MKLHIKTLLITCLAMYTSCTDVIDVEVPVAKPRLVVEASINWEKGTTGNNQTITLSTSTPFFSNSATNAAVGATVTITNDVSGDTFVFSDLNNGSYTNSNFIPVINNSYTLQVLYNGEQYEAKETLMAVPDVVDVYQSKTGGFNNEALEVNIDFLDPENENNFYFFRFKQPEDLLPELLSITDEFTNGNIMTVFYEKQEDESINQVEFKPGDAANIEFYGVSRQFSNYISILIDQAETGGNPFSTIPVALNGNCVNITNPDNDAFGYFRLSQVVNVNYIFQ